LSKKNKKVELLAPAGNWEKMEIALRYGADAVYLSGQFYGLRASAGNFSQKELAEAVDYVHGLGKKIYVTVNIFAHNTDLNGVPQYLAQLEDYGVDAIIVSDPGIIMLAKKYAPRLTIHLSTQANTTNWASTSFWKEEGIARIVLSRELSLSEIKVIANRNPDMEIEAFVHGAMCMSYSGRCMLSSFLTGKSANHGECTHPCRWKYYLMEEKRPGEYMPVLEDDRGAYIFNSKDLCMIEHIPELINSGIDSFKIEGRMKSIHYVATVVKAYRQAIDSYYTNPAKYLFQQNWLEELEKVSDREYTTGFYFHKPNSTDHNYEKTKLERPYDFVGLVLSYDENKNVALVQQRNKFSVGDVLEVFGPHTETTSFIVTEMYDDKDTAIESAPHPLQRVFLKVEIPLEPYAMLRVKKR
jgi:putative protease